VTTTRSPKNVLAAAMGRARGLPIPAITVHVVVPPVSDRLV
jgi:hypothetical protein